MHPSTLISLLSLLPLTFSTPLNPRTSCTTPSGSGTCQSTSSCSASGFSIAGYCPGDASNQCCISHTCSTTAGSGSCLNTSSGCSGGTFHAGACPGDSSIQCCIKTNSQSSPPPSSSGGDVGSKVVAAAEAEKGLPYVFGGGGVSGPTKGGFDCSGLTQYSVYKATGKTIPRTADRQYESGAGGKHLPRGQAQKGDLIFWAKGGNCATGVEHVGIFISEGLMVNAATTGTPVREQSIWISSGGLSICPDAVRFW